jgi:MFS family permease
MEQGQSVGVMLSGPTNERGGRKACILAAAVLYSIGAVLMAANFGSIPELLAGRVLSGLGSGFGMTTGAIYISEIAPREIRGCLSTFYNLNIMAGVTGSYWINYGSLLHISSDSSWQWRVPMVSRV